MIRIVFVLFIAIHGLIHLMGFTKAFGWAQLEQLSQDISRSKGLWWLAAAILIVLAALLFLTRQAWWWLPGMLGAIISQILIFSQWSDARAGTLPNLILLLVAILGLGAWKFKQSVRSQLDEFRPQTSVSVAMVSDAAVSALPVPVQKWLDRTGITGKEKARNVHLQQVGKMRTAADGKWMQFKAEQWFRVDEPAFLWYANVGAGSPVRLNGRDQLIGGRGHMLIKLFGLIPIVDANGPTIDQGSLLRYLAEIIWFPSAALEPYISWEPIDELHARAILRQGDQSVHGVFSFNAAGDITGFEALRYYDRGGSSTLEVWHIDVDTDSYRQFQGIRIPAKSAVSWKLKDGEFRWLELEITELAINGD